MYLSPPGYLLIPSPLSLKCAYRIFFKKSVAAAVAVVVAVAVVCAVVVVVVAADVAVVIVHPLIIAANLPHISLDIYSIRSG